ncbi:MAG TPA: acyltransferase [Ktedonobacteraceae bacterium]|jgi:peptidoglycan/LPS O-acetylase OafA/YrhL
MTIGQWIQAEVGNVPKKNTIPLLDGVRAIACLMVIWFHIYRIPRDLSIWPTRPFTNLLLNTFLFFGKYGVTLFFVLSGFLLFLPFARSLLFEQAWPSTREFYLRRVFRILPAYYLSLILMVFVFQQQYLQPQHRSELGLFFIFFMDSSQATFKHLNAPFWTLAVEWQFYMLLPLLAMGMRSLVRRVTRAHRMRTIMLCIMLVMAWGLFSRYFGNYYVYQHPTETVLVPRPLFNGFLALTYGVSGKYLEDFGVGMLLSLCLSYSQRATPTSRLSVMLRRSWTWLWAAGPLCLLLMILWSYNYSYPHTWPLFSSPLLFQMYALGNELGIALAFGLCISALLFGPARLKQPFEWLALRWLGTISYSLYMWHLPLLLLCIQWVQPLLTGWSPEQAYAIYWLWILVVVLPFCFFFFKLVEEPGIRLGKRLLPHRTPAARPPEHTRPLPVVQGLRNEPMRRSGEGMRGNVQEVRRPTALPPEHHYHMAGMPQGKGRAAGSGPEVTDADDLSTGR